MFTWIQFYSFAHKQEVNWGCICKVCTVFITYIQCNVYRINGYISFRGGRIWCFMWVHSIRAEKFNFMDRPNMAILHSVSLSVTHKNCAKIVDNRNYLYASHVLRFRLQSYFCSVSSTFSAEYFNKNHYDSASGRNHYIVWLKNK